MIYPIVNGFTKQLKTGCQQCTSMFRNILPSGNETWQWKILHLADFPLPTIDDNDNTWNPVVHIVVTVTFRVPGHCGICIPMSQDSLDRSINFSGFGIPCAGYIIQ